MLAVVVPSSLVKFASVFATCHSASFADAVTVFDPVEPLVVMPLKVNMPVTPSTSHEVEDGDAVGLPPRAERSSVTLEDQPERSEHPL